MNALRTMQTTQVNDCYLKFTERDDIKMPVAKFTAVYALDKIPQCSVVPALGRELVQGARVSLKQIAEGDAVELWIKIDGSLRLIMQGFIATISGSDNSTPFSRKLSASIVIKHNLVKLAGAPAASFAYTTAIYGDTIPMSMIGSMHPLFGNIGGKRNSLSPVSMFVDEIDLAFGTQDVAVFPTSVLRYIAAELMTSYATTDEAKRESIKQEVDDILSTYDGAELTFIPEMSSIDLLEKFANKYIATWQTSNNWQALVSTAAHLFLHVVPYNTGAYLANPLSLIRTPAKLIYTKEYTNLAQQITDSLTEPIDGIVLRSPTPTLENKKIIFPEPTEDDRDKPRYYHFREFPDWVRSYISLRRGPYTSGGVSEKERAAVQLKRNEDTSPRQTEEAVGTALAKAIFADLKSKQAGVNLTLPYREDLMPGTIVSIVSTSVEDMSFIGDTLYGMIATTTIECDMLMDSGLLNTTVSIASVRDSKDNEDDNMTIPEHPLYRSVWPGTDLFGTLLSTPDNIGKAPERTAKANVNNTATNRDAIAQPIGQG